MSDEQRRTADWAPGTLDKTRKNIGDISKSEAEAMAKKLGGEVMYEKSAPSTLTGTSHSKGAIVRSSPMVNNGPSNSSSSSGTNSSSPATSSSSKTSNYTLPVIPKKMNSLIDKVMMSPEYKIKQNYGFFNIFRSFSKNGTEKVNPDILNYLLPQQISHLESFITMIKTIIQSAPSTYKSKISGNTEPKFKFLKMIAGWSMQKIKIELVNLQNKDKPLLVSDYVPYTQTMFRMILTVYYYGSSQIPKLIKEIYNDLCQYPDINKEKFQKLSKQAMTDWIYIEDQIIKRMYPMLLRMCCTSYETYSAFYTTRIAEILKFVGLHKFDLLMPEKDSKPAVEEKPKPKPKAPPQKGIKDSTVDAGLKLLNQLFPGAGFDKLDEHKDLYPYFQPLYNFEEGFNMLSNENPVQLIIVLHRIIEDCLVGCRNIKFVEEEEPKKGTDTLITALSEWSAYREETFERLYCNPLKELVNSSYSQADFDKSHIGKRIITSLLWQVTYHFMPNFKFDQLILEHPTDESEIRPLFHRTDFLRKQLTIAVNECDAVAKTRGPTKMIENPWEHYHFEVKNEVSKRLDVLLGAQNKTSTTSATNANLLKYTLCFISVLDWVINNPDSPAYQSNPMHIYRINPEDGKPAFSVTERTDQNKLFVESIKATYQKQAK